MTFVSTEGHVVGEKNMEFRPDDSVNLSAPCPGGGADGEIDVESRVRSMAEAGDTESRSQARCARPTYGGGASSVCGCEVRCHVKIAYRA